MPKLLVNLLGTFQVLPDGQSGENNLSLGYDKARALFAFLIVESGRPHRRDALAGLLWPDMPDADALHNLRLAIYTLRRALAKVVESDLVAALLDIDAKTITCHPEALVQVDVADFLQAAGTWEAHRHPPQEVCPACLPGLERATRLYRGEFLAGFFLDSTLFEEWVLAWRERLRQKALAALHTLLMAMQQEGHYPAAIEVGRRILAIEPWDEHAYSEMMKALAAAGRRSEALALYPALGKILADELGTEPGDEVRQVYGWLLQTGSGQSASQWPGVSRPSAQSARIFPHFSQAVSRQASPFVGRASELEFIETVFKEKHSRLLVIFGPGGVGKSRLAIQAAAQLEPGFRDGACLVPLSGVSTPDLIVPAMLSALQIAPSDWQGNGQDGAGKQLLAALAERQMLLVIDNLEHLVAPGRQAEWGDGPARLFTDIVAAAPQVCLLVTSRIRLNCPGEQVLALRGLDTPEETGSGMESGSLQLFVESACRADPAFDPSGDHLPVLIRICRYLEGIPLSLELAAAWLRVLSLGEIEQALHSDMGLLSTPQEGPNLGPVFDRSWDLLTGEVQAVFARLSIFPGGFDQEAAAAVAGANLFHLASLVDQSVLWRSQAGRFYIHEQLRQYVAAKLAQVPGEPLRTGQRFTAYFVDFVARRAAQLFAARERGEPSRALLSALEACVDNLRLCARMLLSEPETPHEAPAPGHTAEFFAGLGLFFEYQGWHQEAAGLYRSVIDQYGSNHATAGNGGLAGWQNCLAQAYVNLEEYSLSLMASQAALANLGRPVPQNRLGLWSQVNGQALRQAARRLGLAFSSLHSAGSGLPAKERRSQDTPGKSMAAEELKSLMWLALASFRSNRHDLLVYATLRLINAAEAAGSASLAGAGYTGMMFMLSFMGFYSLAHLYNRLAERAALEVENLASRAGLHGAQGRFCMQIGLFHQSARELEQAALLYKKINDYRNWIEMYNAWVTALHGLGQFYQASELWKQQVQIARQNGDRLYQGVALGGLAVASIRLEEYQQALDYCSQAVCFLDETPWPPRQVILFAVQALAHIHLGQVESAQLSLEAGVQIMIKEPPRIFLMGEGLSFLLETALAMQEEGISEAGRYSRLLLEVMKRLVRFIPAYTVRLWFYRGAWEWQRGRERQALAAWKKSLAIARQLDLPYEQARASQEIGCHLPSLQ